MSSQTLASFPTKSSVPSISILFLSQDLFETCCYKLFPIKWTISLFLIHL